MINDGGHLVSVAEAEAARRLAEALDGKDATGADPEALAAVRLLASLQDRPKDEVGRRRGGLDVTARVVAAARGRLIRRLLVPLAATLVLSAGLLGRRLAPVHVSEDLLAAKEAAARQAFAALATDVDDLRSARAESLLADLSDRRFEAIRASRLSSPSASPDATPVPPESPQGGRT